jgi:hypothetical protein
VAEAAIEMVCGGVCPTVQEYPGHIDPATVGQELPAFVKRVRSHGLRVTQIKGPALKDATEPNAERIIATAAQAGCTHYSIGGYTYDFSKPLAPQLDAVKLRIEKLVRVSEKHRITFAYAPVAGAASVGGPVPPPLPNGAAAPTSSGWISTIRGGLGGWLESSNAFAIIASIS